jgi:sulfate adenylyltransferase
MLIEPHGGTLVDRKLVGNDAKAALVRARTLPHIQLTPELAQDTVNVSTGVFSPLTGFLQQEDFESVLDKGRLANGLPWTIPLVLDVTQEQADEIREGADVTLLDARGEPLALLHVAEKYRYSKERYARQVYGTTDTAHPGVVRINALKDVLLGGSIELLREPRHQFDKYNLSPKETRVLFREKGWKSVVAFQTRNVPHTGHENLHKTVLGLVDGLYIQPIIGKKKRGDFKDELILRAYEVLIENYYVKERVVFSILPTEMRYAGPREAIHHAIMRKNYGCTHLIIGRDHAGVGNFYHPEAAIEIFDRYEDIGIRPITIRGDFFYCRVCEQIASDRTCPHPAEKHIPFSGTKIREMIKAGQPPPRQIMRPEVFEVLKGGESPFVE